MKIISSDKGSNIYYTTNALNEFLNWAVGETKIYKDISPLAKVLSNKKHSITYIQDFIYTNNLNRDELTIGLQAALLKPTQQRYFKSFDPFGC